MKNKIDYHIHKPNLEKTNCCICGKELSKLAKLLIKILNEKH